MRTLFDAAALSDTVRRIDLLRADSSRLWGKMPPAQMLAHCSIALELAAGDRRGKQMLLGKFLSRFVKTKLLGEQPFSKNGPTAPVLVVADARDFNTEKARLLALVQRFGEGGPGKTTRDPHLFFGPLTGE